MKSSNHGGLLVLNMLANYLASASVATHYVSIFLFVHECVDL